MGRGGSTAPEVPLGGRPRQPIPIRQHHQLTPSGGRARLSTTQCSRRVRTAARRRRTAARAAARGACCRRTWRSAGGCGTVHVWERPTQPASWAGARRPRAAVRRRRRRPCGESGARCGAIGGARVLGGALEAAEARAADGASSRTEAEARAACRGGRSVRRNRGALPPPNDLVRAADEVGAVEAARRVRARRPDDWAAALGGVTATACAAGGCRRRRRRRCRRRRRRRTAGQAAARLRRAEATLYGAGGPRARRPTRARRRRPRLVRRRRPPPRRPRPSAEQEGRPGASAKR